MVTLPRKPAPRISVNKLGEYLSARPARRQQIVRDQKKQRTFIAARYADAERAIGDYVTDPFADTSALAEVVKEILSTSHESDWKTENAELCAKAIRAFMAYADEIPFNSQTPFVWKEQFEKFNISGVNVSVRPEILLASPNNQEHITGAVKLYFSKMNPLDDNTGEFIAAIVYRYLTEVMSTETTVKTGNCLVIDVLAGRFIKAPKNWKRQMKDAVAACAEIAALWAII